MKVALVAPSLTFGGAERVVHTLATGFQAAGHSVTVITTTSRPDFYRLPPGIDRVALDLTGSPPGEATRWTALPRTLLRLPAALKSLRNAIRRSEPDVVVSFMEHVNVLALATVGRRIGVVVTEHAPSGRLRLGSGWRLLRRLLYRRAACLVSVSQGTSAGFAWLPARQRHVIANPLPSVFPEAPLPPALEAGPFVAAMGRLRHEKGFDLLIEAFLRIADRHPDWRLAIVGEGEERPALERAISAGGLNGRVHLLGVLAEPFGIVRASQFFVLSSRFEGFGNALAEALACGRPVVSFDCPDGPAELVVDDHNGLLVVPEDVDALSAAMDRMMTDGDLRRRLAEQAASSVAWLRVEDVVRRWEREVFPVAAERTGSGRV